MRRNRTSYGKKGGTSATAGKTKAIYEAEAPDGSILRVGSFQVQSAEAYMHISCHGGACWYGNGVRDVPEDWGCPAAVDGHRVAVKAEWIKCKRVR